jgi:hypothetical protein
MLKAFCSYVHSMLLPDSRGAELLLLRSIQSQLEANLDRLHELLERKVLVDETATSVGVVVHQRQILELRVLY